jgi:AraC-like DNA-binding protein
MSPPGAPSVLSSWTRVIIDALEAEGLDADAVLARAGFAADAFDDPNVRHPVAATRPLWRAAVEAFGDPACGLRISNHVRPATFHALGYAVFASGSLREALHRLVRYSHLVTDATVLALETTPSAARLIFRRRVENDMPTYEALDAVMSLIVRTCRMLTERRFSLERMEQRRPPPENIGPYERFYRCPLFFAADSDAITVSAAWLDRQLPSANPELARHNDDLVRRYLAQIEQGTLVDRVRSVLAENLAGDASPARIARALGLSERSLQRHLAQLGTTFAEVLNETRRELACGYLREPRWSVTEIAFLLGFEDSSSFARAFRRWTGQSPSEYRAAHTAP